MAPQAESSTVLAFNIEGKRHEIDLDELEFGEVEMLEEAFDASFEEIDLSRMKAIRILVFIAMRRNDPTVTMDRISSLTVKDFEPAEQEKRPTKKASAKTA